MALNFCQAFIPLFLSIELLHLLPRFCLTVFGVRRGYAVGEILLLNLELKATAFIIVHYFTQLRIFFRERKQPIFEACVIGDDRCPLASLIKIYLGRFVRFLNACNHIFQKPPIFLSCEKYPCFCSKKPRSASVLFAIFPTA